MPVGEFIADVLILGIFEILLYGLLYYTGAPVLRLLSLGQLRLAPLGSIYNKNRKKPGQRFDWSIWLRRPKQGKMLKAEYVVLTDIVVWAGIGLAIFIQFRAPEPKAKQAAEAALRQPTSVAVESYP